MVRLVQELRKWAVDLSGGYRCDCVEVPHGTDWYQTPWECDDRSIDVPKSSGSIWFRVFFDEDTTWIASAIFAADDEFARCDDVNVDPGHQRRGIATFLYALASIIFEARVIRSDSILKDGEKLWEGKDFFHFEDYPEISEIYYRALDFWLASTDVRNA